MAATSFFSVFWQNSKHFKAFALRSSSPNFDLDFHHLFPLSPRNLEKSEDMKPKVQKVENLKDAPQNINEEENTSLETENEEE